MNNFKSISKVNGHEPMKGLLAGIAAGLVASWTMNKFQSLWSRAFRSDGQMAGQRAREMERQGQHQQVQQLDKEAEAATTKAAVAIAQRVFHHQLTPRQKKLAEPAVHYAFGTTIGAAYGLLAEVAPPVTSGFGLAYATAVWLVGDEMAVPALGLSKSPAQYPLSSHVYALVSLWVYGLTAEAVRRGVRAVL